MSKQHFMQEITYIQQTAISPLHMQIYIHLIFAAEI